MVHQKSHQEKKGLIVCKSDFPVFLCIKIYSVPLNHLRSNFENGDQRGDTNVQLQYMGISVSNNWMEGIDLESFILFAIKKCNYFCK